MVIALAACMVVVVFAIMMAPKGDYVSERTVDVKEAAAQAKGGVDFKLYVPDLPKGWTANEAGNTKMGDPAQDTWYVSIHGPNDAWVTVRQAHADERWANSLEDDAVEVGTQAVSGTQFTRYETPKGKQLLVGSLGDSELALVGTATWDDFAAFAKQAVAQR